MHGHPSVGIIQVFPGKSIRLPSTAPDPEGKVAYQITNRGLEGAESGLAKIWRKVSQPFAKLLEEPISTLAALILAGVGSLLLGPLAWVNRLFRAIFAQ